jgi:hypothetical protein
MAEAGVDWVGIALHAVTLVLWLAVLVGVGGVALWRLGRSRAGLALGGGFWLWAVQRVALALFALVVPGLGLDYSLVVVGQTLLGGLLTLAVLALIAVGLLGLPAALDGARDP